MSLHFVSHLYVKVGLFLTLVLPNLAVASQPSSPSLATSTPDSQLDSTALADPYYESTLRLADAKNLVKLMQDAYRKGRFEMVALKLSQGHLEPLSITHGVLPVKTGAETEHKRSIEHHLYLNGPVFEVLKIDEQLHFFEQGQQALVLNAEPLPGLLPKLINIDLEQLSESYRLIVAGRNRIAGRIAQAIRVLPKDPSLYPIQLWLDTATMLPLRVDLLNRQEQLIGQFTAVSLTQFTDNPTWLDNLANIALPMHAINDKETAAMIEPEPKDWQLAWLPKGLKPVFADSHALALTQTLVTYKKFSNGLVDVSVYLAKYEKGAQIRPQRVLQSTISLYSMLAGEFEITVVGEIPLETAQRIAESIIIPAQSDD